MKLLFLDMDGVILPGEAIWKSHDVRALPKAQVDLLNEVCRRTGCQVVLSSTWRREGRGILSHIEKEGFTGTWAEAWRTPTNTWVTVNGVRKHLALRGHEIQAYLENLSSLALSCDAYAIIDDDSDFLEEQMRFLVKTEFETGMQRHHAEALIAILGEQEARDAAA